MNKIKINSQLNDWTFCVLATVTLMGLIERGQSIVMLAVFALISLLSGAAFIFIFSILIDRKKEIKVSSWSGVLFLTIYIYRKVNH